MNQSKKIALTGAAIVAGLFALSVCAGLLWGTGSAFTRLWGMIA